MTKSGLMLACATLLATAATTTPASAAASAYPAAPGHGFRDKSWAPELMVIPAGRYLMGSPDAETTAEGRAPKYAAFEHPQAEVAVPELAVGKYHVTVADYARFVSATKRPLPAACNIVQDHKWSLIAGKSFKDMGFPQTDRSPVGCVGWDDAVAYTAWLSQQTGHHYRLLHETEWEYAARGGTTTARWWGNGREALCQHVNGADQRFDKILPGEADTNRTCDDGYGFTNPVDAFPANPFGLHDMLGNLWQWTADCFTPALPVAPGPVTASGTCPQRAIRGGSWHNYPSALRVANRFSLPVDMHSSSLGFRIVRLPDDGSVI